MNKRLEYCKKVSSKLLEVLDDVDCFENCPLKKICDKYEEENKIDLCRILFDLREEDI